MDGLRDEIKTTNEQIREMLDIIRQASGGPTQTIIHRNEGMGAWGAAAVVACFLTYLSLIIFALWAIFQINNLTAWKDVYGRDLAAIKQQVTSTKQEKSP